MVFYSYFLFCNFLIHLVLFVVMINLSPMEIIYGWGSFAVRYMLSLCVRPCLCVCTANVTILKLLIHVSIFHVNLQTVWLFNCKEHGNSDSKSEIWVLTTLLALGIWSRFSEV